MDYLTCFTRLFFLIFAFNVNANNIPTAELKQQANQFLTEFQNNADDGGELDQLEVTSQELLKKLQNCEKQAESDLSELTDIREIEALKSGSQENKKDNMASLPSGRATQEVDRQINESTQRLITCRLKSNQVAKARLTLLNQKQNLWLEELTKRQAIWSFINQNQQTSTSTNDLAVLLPLTPDFFIFAVLGLIIYSVMFGLNRSYILNISNKETSEIKLKKALIVLLKLHLVPLLLALAYLLLTDVNQWHVLILFAGLLVRDSCSLFSMKQLIGNDEVKVYKRYMWYSSCLLVLVAFGFNGLHFKDNSEAQWLVNYSQFFTPLIILTGVILSLTCWFFYQALHKNKDRYIPLFISVMAALSVVAYISSFAHGAQYIMLIITGMLILHWSLKTVNGLRKTILRKKISALKEQQENNENTFAFPFWISLFTALITGLLGIVFLGWLAGVSEEAFKQLSFVFTEGFDVGSVRLVPQDILIGLIIITLLTLVLSSVKSGIQNKWFDKSRLRKSSREVFSMIVWYIGITIAVFIGLTVAGFDISNLAIIAGALSVGIGFGLQNIVSNFVSGLILLFERPVTRGDWVEVGQTVGLIEKVKIRATRIRTFDNAEILVPNSELLSHHVTNWTLSNSIGRITLKVGVAYGSDIIAVREILNDIALNHEQVMQREPFKHKVLFRQFGDSSLNFELRVMIKDIKMFLDVETDLNFAIDQALREAGITIPFPQRDLHIKGTSEFKMTDQYSDQSNEHGNKQGNKSDSTQNENNVSSQSKSENTTADPEEKEGKGEVEQMIEDDEKRKKQAEQENKDTTGNSD